MKTNVIVFVVDVTILTIYQNIVKSNVSNKKFTIINDIIVYDDIFVVQIQLINVIDFYFNF